MSKYKNSKVYRIISDSNPDLVYYGSTYCKLSNRLSKHKNNYKRYLKEKSHYVTSFDLIKLDDCKIILVEKYPCTDKEELRMRERFYIENNQCVNKVIPGRTKKEYYKDNRENIEENSKIYYENNREKISKRCKKYYENNKEKCEEYYKQYRENISSKPITCECGRDMARGNLTRHLKSKIHFNKMINYLQL